MKRTDIFGYFAFGCLDGDESELVTGPVTSQQTPMKQSIEEVGSQVWVCSTLGTGVYCRLLTLCVRMPPADLKKIATTS